MREPTIQAGEDGMEMLAHHAREQVIGCCSLDAHQKLDACAQLNF
jgi:hypothetical protein